MISVILAEDHHMVREGFKRLLAEHSGIRVLADVGDGRDAVELVERLKADILLLDLAIPGLNGLEVIRRLQGKYIKILVVSMHADEARVIEALKSGASGYVLKDSSATELIEAIETVAKGLPFITPSLRNSWLTAALRIGISGRKSEALTPREKEVLKFAAEGESSATIGAKLVLSPRTIESYRAGLMKKLGLKSQTDLVRYAIRSNLCDL